MSSWFSSALLVKCITVTPSVSPLLTNLTMYLYLVELSGGAVYRTTTQNIPSIRKKNTKQYLIVDEYKFIIPPMKAESKEGSRLCFTVIWTHFKVILHQMIPGFAVVPSPVTLYVWTTSGRRTCQLTVQTFGLVFIKLIMGEHFLTSELLVRTGILKLSSHLL